MQPTGVLPKGIPFIRPEERFLAFSMRPYSVAYNGLETDLRGC
jgi:hypothetical protein